MTPYHEVLLQCGERYRIMLTHNSRSDNALWAFVHEFISGCQARGPIPKLCRWLGYIQGCLIERGITTVTAERDWTRPLFRPLDFPAADALPPPPATFPGYPA